MQANLAPGFRTRPTTGQTRSAAPTRTDTPREALPQPWLVNLARHVDCGRVSSGGTVAFGAAGMCIAFVVALVLLSGCSKPEVPKQETPKPAKAQSLDSAQAAFEHSATLWPSPTDFDGWRAKGQIKCLDHEDLRVCEAIFPFLQDGEEVGADRVAFACSTSVCVWVDP